MKDTGDSNRDELWDGESFVSFKKGVLCDLQLLVGGFNPFEKY